MLVAVVSSRHLIPSSFLSLDISYPSSHVIVHLRTVEPTTANLKKILEEIDCRCLSEVHVNIDPITDDFTNPIQNEGRLDRSPYHVDAIIMRYEVHIRCR